MKRLRRGWRRLTGSVGGAKREAELRDEIAAHIAMQTDDNVRAGMSVDEARRAAAIKFGSIAAITEDHREQRGLPFLESAVADIRYAWRALRMSPGFTLVAVFTLALGIGANTAAFGLVSQVLLHPPGVSEPERVVVFRTEYDNLGLSFELTSAPALAAAEGGNEIFETAAAYRQVSYNYAGPDSPERLSGSAVSAAWFDVYGARPRLGRVFAAAEDRPGADRVVVLAHGAWMRLFGGDPDVIGRSISLNQEPYTIIGVMGRDFRWPRETDLWVPLALPTQALGPQSWFPENLSVVARLRPDVTPEGADQFLATLAGGVVEQFPPQARRTITDAGWRIETVSFFDSSARVTKTPLLILFGAVGVVLLIACSNVAGLTLARMSARMRELGVRAALGATRARLNRGVLAESLLLSVAGGGLGILIANATARLLIALAPENAVAGLEPQMDRYVLAFAIAASLTAGLLFGLVPLWHLSKAGLYQRLRTGGRSYAGEAHQRLRSGLVVVETALALVLLAAAGLFLQSIERLQEVDPGFDPQGVMTASFALPTGTDGEALDLFIRDVLERLETSAGVRAATIGRPIPFSGVLESGAFFIEGRTVPQGEPVPLSDRRWVTPGYLDTLGIPLRSGRFFTDRDRAGSEPVVVIDERLARQYWPDEEPVGQRIRLTAAGEPLRILGVVGHVRQSDLASDADSGVLYLSLLQNPLPMGSIAVKGAGADTAALTGAIRDAVHGADANLPLYDLRPMESIVGDSLAPRVFLLRVLAFFAGAALFLAVLGIYGVVSYTVALRTREIGVRLAMGAQGASVMKLVLGQAFRLAATGVAIGLAVTLAAFRVVGSQSFEVSAGVRFVQTQLFEVSAFDPVMTIVMTASVLLGTALLASYIPARRASRVDPMTTLRQE